MEQVEFKAYKYRWVVLIVFMLVIFMNQVSWITFAPITGQAATFYHVSDLRIGLLSLMFMMVYIAVSIPASWIIDTRGIRFAVGIGAILTGVFGFMRGLVGDNYNLVLTAQIGIAIGQPFILNSMTTVAARWFPQHQRATAAGFGSLAMYVGIATGMALTPLLSIRLDIPGMLMVYGGASPVVAILFFIFAKDRPPSPPSAAEQEERSLVYDGLILALKRKNFIYLLILFFIGLGIFNAVTTWVEDILRPRGFSIVEAGTIGGIMIFGGIFGAVILPYLSDQANKRIPFLKAVIIGATIGLAGITFAQGFWVILISAFIFGFFLLSAGPLGFQYGAEVTYPAPEGTSNGLLLLVGQISGIIFILAMDIFKDPETGSMSLPLAVLIGLLLIALFFTHRLKEADDIS